MGNEDYVARWPIKLNETRLDASKKKTRKRTTIVSFLFAIGQFPFAICHALCVRCARRAVYDQTRSNPNGTRPSIYYICWERDASGRWNNGGFVNCNKAPSIHS